MFVAETKKELSVRVFWVHVGKRKLLVMGMRWDLSQALNGK